MNFPLHVGLTLQERRHLQNTNKPQNRMMGLMRVRNLHITAWVKFYVLNNCSTYRFSHFSIFDLTVSFSEMRGSLLILVCGLFHPVTL